MTDDEPSGEQEEEVAPPGWYADPYGAPEMRRWDGKRWTLEGKPWPTPEVEVESSVEEAGTSPAPFNWPALVATLVMAGSVAFMFQPNCIWEDDGASVYGACLARDLPRAYNALDVLLNWALGPLLVLFGLLGVRRKYARGRWVAGGLAALGVCLFAAELLWWLNWQSSY